jgi:hypothetical protein
MELISIINFLSLKKQVDMKFIEKALMVLSVLALIMLFNQYSGSSWLLFISLLLLGCIYFPLGFLFFSGVGLREMFKGALKNVRAKTLVLAFFTGLGLAALCTAIMFKFFDLKGARELLISGLCISLITLIINIVVFFKTRSAVASKSLVRLAGFTFIGIALLSVSSVDLIRLRYRNYPGYVEAYSNFVNHPSPETERKRNVEFMRIVLGPEDFAKYEEMLNK